MKKRLIFIGLLLILSLSVFVGAQKTGEPGYRLTSCTDSDGGNDPLNAGEVYYEDESIDGSEKGTSRSSDGCSGIHWVNVLLYAGAIDWADPVLVEHVCPEVGTFGDEAGDIQIETIRIYKCKCEDSSGGGKGVQNKAVCVGDDIEEIPHEIVKEAELRWRDNSKEELHPTFARFLRFFGFWG